MKRTEIIGILVLLIMALFSNMAFANLLFELKKKVILPDAELKIPVGYKTYSLFLVNNPQWLLPESGERLLKLFQSFQAFGDSIGRDHLAVWFLKNQQVRTFKIDTPTSRELMKYALINNIDVTRSSAFCRILTLQRNL